jgi:hypothetical protein
MQLLPAIGSQAWVRTFLGPLGSRNWLGFGLFALLSCGCQARIGAGCTTNQQCSGETQRLCDISQPGGYCTVLNCSPTSCPAGEAICVTFANAVSSLPACQNGSKPSPYARSLCMQYCVQDADCRADYKCVDISGDDPWSADIVSKDARYTKICISPPVSASLPEDRATGVCFDGVGGEGGGGGESNR